MSLTPDQVQIIKATVPVLKEHGNAITTHFYATLLKENPDLNNIFNQTNQVNGHQPAALAGSLYAYASHIDDLGVLSPAVEKICQKHASLYIKPEHYDIVGTYLLRAMGDVLGDALTPEILEAWGQAYWQLAHLMIKREDDLLKASDGWTDWRDFRIVRKEPESSEITSFYLSPLDGNPLPAFLPGQYISVMMDVPEFKYKQSRQYSLSDAPTDKYYRVSVKWEHGLSGNGGEKFNPGYISNILHASKEVGDVIQVSHPAGEFFLDPSKDKEGPVVLISAGVGLTPMVSILNTLVREKSQRPISWVHATRSSEAQAFAKHIQNVAKENENVTAVVFNKSPAANNIEGVDFKYKSRMDLDVLDKSKDLHLEDRLSTYYVCGPDSFMTAVAAKLKDLGVDAGRIRMEVFGTGMIPA